MRRCLLNKIGKISLQLTLILFSLVSTTYAQHLSFGAVKPVVEVGLNFGPTFFLGDLGGHRGEGTPFLKDLNLPLTKMMKGVFLTAYPNNWMGIRLGAQLTYVEGRDNIISTKGEDELWRKQRNLDFKSDIWEVYTAVEIYPTMLFSKEEDFDPKFRPYGFIGVGMFNFNPKGSIINSNGSTTWHELHPLRTEGQGMAAYPEKKEYSLTQINIPMGMGVKVKLSERVNTSFELLYRKTFTDYIDDVSTSYIDPNQFDRYLAPREAAIARKIHDKTIGIVTPGVNRYEPGTQRGNPNNMDAYFSCLIRIGVRMGEVYESSSSRRFMQKTRCPHRF